MNNKTHNLAQGAVIAALYTVLTLVSSTFGLASGVVQIRLSEAMTILPIFTPAAVPGLCVGCFISNLLFSGLGIIDVFFGTFATFIGCLLAYKFRHRVYKGKPILSGLMIVICNAILIGIELGILEKSLSILFITSVEIAISESIIVFIIGLPLYNKMIQIVKDSQKK